MRLRHRGLPLSLIPLPVSMGYSELLRRTQAWVAHPELRPLIVLVSLAMCLACLAGIISLLVMGARWVLSDHQPSERGEWSSDSAPTAVTVKHLDFSSRSIQASSSVPESWAADRAA